MNENKHLKQEKTTKTAKCAGEMNWKKVFDKPFFIAYLYVSIGFFIGMPFQYFIKAQKETIMDFLLIAFLLCIIVGKLEKDLKKEGTKP